MGDRAFDVACSFGLDLRAGWKRWAIESLSSSSRFGPRRWPTEAEISMTCLRLRERASEARDTRQVTKKTRAVTICARK